jgi:hypothetical protein
MELINGTAYGTNKEIMEKLSYMRIALDEIKQGNERAVTDLKNSMKGLNERLAPKTAATVGGNQKTPQQIAEEEAAKAEERRKRRERLLGQSVSGGNQTPQTTPVRPLVNENQNEDPIDND